jgi:hypothetical protein
MRLWSFDRLGAIASVGFNIHQDGSKFVSAVLGFLLMNDEQLGFDPTIIKIKDKGTETRYVDIQRGNCTERLVLDRVITCAHCVVGRATTCWKAYRDGNKSGPPLVIKDSWQYLKLGEEGKLLREAAESGVVNVARYYHHETVRVGKEDDTVFGNVRQGLDVTKATKIKGGPMQPVRSLSQKDQGLDVTKATKIKGGPMQPVRSLSQKDQGSTAIAGQKRASGDTDALMPLPKRARPEAHEDRVHRRVIVQDYGRPIYMASSPTMLLKALEHCIAGYESLHTEAEML